MQREPLSPELDALWRRLWEEWQSSDEEDVFLDAEKGRVKTALAYLQRAYYIQYRSGVGEAGIEPILYDVYEPR